jgi:6-phosphogluconolactonase
MAWIESDHADADALATACAARIGALITRGLQTRGRAALALAGGRTSPPVFRRLATMPLRWDHVTVVPTDERWVPFRHADCNLRALREAFAGAEGLSSLRLVPDPPGGPPDATFANAQLATLPDTLDAVLLGMGADGHFASLFPGAANLAAALDPDARADAVAIVPSPLPAAGPHPRVSLTLARLLRSRAVVLAISGADKRATLRRAQAEPEAVPVGALLHAHGTQVEIHWSP